MQRLVWGFAVRTGNAVTRLNSNEKKNRKRTPGNPVRGSRQLCTQNLSANFRPWLSRHPNSKEFPHSHKRVSCPNLLIFSHFIAIFWKIRTMLFPTTFISAQEKMGVSLKTKKKKKDIFFNLLSPWEGYTDIPVLIFQCKMKVFSAIWASRQSLAHPNHEGKLGSNFGWISPSSLGTDIVSDEWVTDAQKTNVALAHPYNKG